MNTFIEVDHYQASKSRQLAEGDVFLSRKIPGDNRVVSVLSDGLGSGIKAGVLSTLTATMALSCIAGDIPVERTARIIMKTLPVCSERRISYATFTIVDIDRNLNVRVMEYDNPPFILLRQGRIERIEKEPIRLQKTQKRENTLHHCIFVAQPGDRLVFFSDGVTQSGIGTGAMPLGWGYKGVENFVLDLVLKDAKISARDLARSLVKKSIWNDVMEAKDDITCGVIYFRDPRKTLVVTGPPIAAERDKDVAAMIRDFGGKKIVAGGTTANLVARELGRKVTVCLKNLDPQVPPYSEMEGVDLVTEGIITMGKVAELLEREVRLEGLPKNSVTLMTDLFLNSDVIQFVIGTRINEAHQDPNVPVELEIRRNIVKRVAAILERKYLKEVRLQFV